MAMETTTEPVSEDLGIYELFDNLSISESAPKLKSKSSSPPRIPTQVDTTPLPNNTGKIGATNASSAVHLKVRDAVWGSMSAKGRAFQNEDGHVVSFQKTEAQEDRLIVAVFDGHGGQTAASFCEQNFVQFITKTPEFHSPTARGWRQRTQSQGHSQSAVQSSTSASASTKSAELEELESTSRVLSSAPENFVAQSLATAFMECDKAFLEQDRAAQVLKPSPCPQGCAALALVLEKDRLTVANAGDCRAVISRKRRAVALTRDHRPGVPEEKARILAAGARIQGANGKYCYLPGRNIGLSLSRSIGDLAFKECNGVRN